MKLSEIFSEWWRANTSFKDRLIVDRYISQNIKYHYNDVYDEIHKSDRIYFVLSTGRSGTKLLSKLLSKSDQLVDHHSPVPEMHYFDKYAYHNFNSSHNELIKMIDAARYELIRKVLLYDKTYVETNNRITFFAYQLAELFPNARFIHLIRHPLAFVKSGVSRNWYEGTDYNNEGRIVPRGNAKEFEKWPIEEKVAWLWNETNQFIDDFKSTISGDRMLTVRAEDLFTKVETVRGIFDFMKIEPPKDSVVKKLLKKPVNKGSKTKKITFSEEQKGKILALAENNLYHYKNS